jgi:hypothetical protein
VNDELVRKLCAVNPELTQLQLDFFVVDSSCNTLNATVTAGSGHRENITVQFPVGEYTLESFLAYLQQRVEQACEEVEEEPMEIKLSIRHWLKRDLCSHEMNACCSFELIHDSTTSGTELILRSTSTLMQLPGWEEDIVISAGKETKVNTKATSAVTQQLVHDKLVINEQQCHEQLVISTPVLQDELLVESPFVGNRTETVELGLKQPVWKSYARRYTDQSPTLAKLSNSIRNSDAEQECEPLVIANRVFEVKQKNTPQSKPQPHRKPKHRKRKPKIKTAAELREEEFLKTLRKQCAGLLPRDNWRIKQSCLVGVNVKYQSRTVDDELAKQRGTVTSGERGLELCLLHEVHHILSDILLIFHDGTKPSAEVFEIVKQHQSLLLPAICVLYDKGRDDKSKFEDEKLMVIDHPEPELAPKFLVSSSSILHVLALILGWCVQVKIVEELTEALSEVFISTLPEKLMATRKRHYNMALATAASGASDLDIVIDTEYANTKCKNFCDLLHERNLSQLCHKVIHRGMATGKTAMIAKAMLTAPTRHQGGAKVYHIYHLCGAATASKTVDSVLEHLFLEWQELFSLDATEVDSKREDEVKNQFKWLRGQCVESAAERFKTGRHSNLDRVALCISRLCCVRSGSQSHQIYWNILCLRSEWPTAKP